MKDTIIYYLLTIKLFLSKWLRYIKAKLFGISEVMIIDKNNNFQNLTFNFAIIKFLKYIQFLLQSLINKLDYHIQKAQIVKNYPKGQKTIIIDKNNLKVEDLVTITNNMSGDRDDTMGKIIFMKFDIECPVNGQIDMREFLIKYKDYEGNYSHTLHNILVFNDKDVTKDAIINIKTFSSGKIINKKLSYDKVKDRHLIEFHDIDKIISTEQTDKIIGNNNNEENVDNKSDSKEKE